MEDKIILGMDPGTTLMGYGIVHVKSKKLHLVTMGVIHLNKLPEHSDKLKRIFERTLQLIDSYHPDEFAVEAPFYGKNVQSMLKLGRAQGVSMAAALYRNIPIMEYAPRKIKQSITGNGNASKEQVAAMLKSLMKIEEMPKHLDATDGLAAAVCHYFQGGVSSGDKKYSSWESFVKNNPKKAR
ncbi:crossover junction endodeoxyribonuclease RuvC [bacterium]|jgi:crossover junction endodeoxyribonuclease RuvC|nr:crossover junction endodeoxyribonuclease RuvC [Crocinitomicaceae bacterium]MDB9984013.1 crossover junction endodeoxyribonuclease RuvC [bacterium]|tara:strand:+ start:24837 stop:25385 length:549 start_codon:yes stop_codon:yes gene_type:complete